MKRKVILVVFSLILIFMMGGCGEKEELETTPSQSLDELISIGSETENGECPEGYVYDYQVSMEPIPEDIAALGGEVCGTIHAYPSRIKIALAKQEIENDEELKRQNEKNVEEIQRYLIDTYGGEFRIELSNLKYKYLCTEIKNGKQFAIHINPSFALGIDDKVVNVDTYYYKENAEIYNIALEECIDRELQENYLFSTFLESGDNTGTDVLKVYIAVLDDNQPEFHDQQNKIISIYRAMKSVQEELDEEMELSLIITYFPMEYKTVIEKQYDSFCQEEIKYIASESCVEKLIESREVYAQFKYSTHSYENEDANLDNWIGREEELNKTILPYWRGVNE